MEGQFVGPMVIRTFFKKYLGVAVTQRQKPPTKKTVKGCFDKVFGCNITENQMYKPLIDALQKEIENLSFTNSHSAQDYARDRLSPDISVYASADQPQASQPLADFSKMSTFIEAKKDRQADPFQDPKKRNQNSPENPFERDTDGARERRAQIGRYSAAISGTQFRTRLFSVSICGDQARFILWDRSAAVVTKTFNYVAQPQILLEFFWLYSRMTPCGQGFDTTVSTASKDEVDQMKKAGCMERLQEANKAHHHEFRKMMIPARDDIKQLSPFLISYPQPYDSRSPFSRSTRSMLAFDLENNQTVFVKDYWRPNIPTIPKEGDIYRKLKDAKVPNVAEFGMGNDLEGHQTVDHRELKLCKYPKITGLQHYRMSLNTIGVKLSKFNSSHELISAMKDAMLAHDAALFDANILHRDISFGNIMFSVNEKGERKGMLIDWDLCLDLSTTASGPRRPARTGTWQFMSADLIDKPAKIQDLVDDRESAFYVLLWVAMQYSKHDRETSTGEEFRPYGLMGMFDEQYEGPEKTPAGGRLKQFYLEKWEHKGPKFTGRPEMNNLMHELVEVLRVRYDRGPNGDVKAKWRATKSILDNLSEEEKKNNPLLPLLQEQLKENPANSYCSHMEDLGRRGWFVETLEKYLDQGQWPKDNAFDEPRFGVTRKAKAGTKRSASQELALDPDATSHADVPASKHQKTSHS
ncbi:hypothetical protein BDN70DRAFT_993445 [Pholiota conissans]|uniref:Fungal-type protein kinase domain-containing protein n=1 Tax=Pholiota conissans TaxID=109636 RepID=A0A9P5Z4V0_9AGAR|nr:hypothetical protein BDN70DRAFT_993445 [Pholiota conissans]